MLIYIVSLEDLNVCVFFQIVVNVIRLNGFKLWIVIDVEYKMVMGTEFHLLVACKGFCEVYVLLDSW